MNKIKQAQENALLSFEKGIQPGRPVGLYLLLTGVNATGKTSGIGDLGSLTVKRGGRTIVNRSLKTLALMGDLRFGSNYFTSTEAGAFIASVYVPFDIEGLPQSLNIEGGDELVVGYDPKPAGIANFDSLNMLVATAEGFQTLPERYEPYILGLDQSIGGAVSDPIQVNDSNVSAIFIEDGSDVVANVGYKNDKGQVYSTLPWNLLKAGTLIENRLETSDVSIVELQLFSNGEPLSYLNKKNIVEVETTGAGLVKITKNFIIPNERFKEWI